jgi:hypothetical protein
MKEYIAEYIVQVEKKGNDYMFDFMNAKRLIQCKDCDWFDTEESWCEFHAFEVPHEEKGFCYWAVEKCRKLPTVNPEMVEAFKKRQKGNR